MRPQIFRAGLFVLFSALSSPPGALAATPMDSVAWTTYDAFSGATIDPQLWDLNARPNMQGTTTIGPGGLTMTVSAQDAVINLNGKDTGVATALAVGPADSFAARVPFSTSGAGAVGGAVFIGISLSSANYSRSYSLIWANASDFTGFGTVGAFNGTAMLLDGPTQSIVPISASQTSGTLGLLMRDGSLSMYYDLGAGWTALGTPIPTSSMVGPLRFDIEANFAKVAADFTALVPEVQFGTPAAVPEPGPGALLALGLLTLLIRALRRH